MNKQYQAFIASALIFLALEPAISAATGCSFLLIESSRLSSYVGKGVLFIGSTVAALLFCYAVVCCFLAKRGDSAE